MNVRKIQHYLQKKLAEAAGRLVPLRERVRRDLPPYLGRIQSATTDLDRAMHTIEARFLQISNSVETAIKLSGEFVEHGEALISLALGQGGGEIIIDSTAEQIWAAIEFVERNTKESEELIIRLNLANDQLSSTLAAEQALTRTLAPLTYLQTLFKVESGGLSPEVQTMFHALVLDIERVREHVESGFREKFELIRKIKEILNRVVAQLGTKTAQAKHTVAGLRTEMTQSLTKMKDSYERNRDRDTRLAGVSHAISRDTGKVVMSLQFHDAMTQKLDHTRKILTEMESRLLSLPESRTETCRMLRFLEQSGRICAAQIDVMHTDLLEAGGVVASGLNEIMQRVAELDGACVALRDLDNVTTGTDGALQILLDSLADVLRLVGTAENFAVESYRTIEPIGGMTTNFTSFIRNLSFEIQLIGLNAEVQSAHIGAGTGLEVLSAQTSAISRETSELSTRLAIELDRLTGELAEMVSSFRGIQERSINFNRTLTGEAGGLNTNLHEYRDSAFKVLHHIGELLPRMDEEIRSATTRSEFISIATQPLTSLQAVVRELGDTAQQTADRSGIKVDPQGLTDHFFSFYTMSGEGDVHRRALGHEVTEKSAPTQPEPTETPPISAAPGVGEVELFGVDEPAAASPEVPSVPPSPAVTGEVDLWLDAPAETPKPTESQAVQHR